MLSITNTITDGTIIFNVINVEVVEFETDRFRCNVETENNSSITIDINKDTREEHLQALEFIKKSTSADIKLHSQDERDYLYVSHLDVKYQVTGHITYP
ncbi:hypothetical protein QUF50_06965 [Thiotrichales bacterium HSG1]|nr:hypothetical protein [Thiotrichales bacterium HSG1]